jgi:hypothetical protein
MKACLCGLEIRCPGVEMNASLGNCCETQEKDETQPVSSKQ